jgi:HAD superfamily hydrolase (TIGR01549 family)
MAIKALLFDIGGVLSRSVDAGPRRKWERRLGLSKGQLAEIVFTSPAAQRATVGKATPDEVWQEVGVRFSLSTEDLKALRFDFWKESQWDMELLDFIRSLKPNYKTGTVSDAWLDARQNIEKYVNSELFDLIVFSAEEGVKKPNPEIYRRSLARLGTAPQETIFVDDRLPNIAGARLIGMHAIHHTQTNRTIEEIWRLLQTHPNLPLTA